MKRVKLIALVALFCAMVLPAAETVKVSGLQKDVKVGKIAKGTNARVSNGIFYYSAVPVEFEDLQVITVPRGKITNPGASFDVVVDDSATLYLLVHNRGKATIPSDWKKTDKKVSWTVGRGKKASTQMDTVYTKQVKAGTKVTVPAHDGRSGSSYGVPNALVLKKDK